MRTYTSLRDLIVNTGATLVEEKFQPEVFGSARVLFSARDGTQFRLVWDGKECCEFLQSLNANGAWGDEIPFVRERMGGEFSNLPEFTETAKLLARRT